MQQSERQRPDRDAARHDVNYPMGEVWTDEDHDALSFLVNKERRFRSLPSRESDFICVEVDTWSGQSTLAIARPKIRVFCLSNWNNDISQDRDQVETDKAFDNFAWNVRDYLGNRIVPIRYEEPYAPPWFPGKADVVFFNKVDCPVLYNHQVRDYTKILKPNGILCGYYGPWARQTLIDLGPHHLSGRIWWHRYQAPP